MLKLNLTGLVFPISYYIGKNNNWDVNFFLNKKKHMNVEQLKELLLTLDEVNYELKNYSK